MRFVGDRRYPVAAGGLGPEAVVRPEHTRRKTRQRSPVRGRRSRREWLRGVRPLLFVPAFGCASAPLPGYRAACAAWRGLAPARFRRSIRSPPSSLDRLAPRCFLGLEPFCAGFARSRPARGQCPLASGRDAPRAARAEAVVKPPPASHRSGGGVSLLFQSRRSPAPGSPRSPARRWGDVPRVRAGATNPRRPAAVAGLSLPGGDSRRASKTVRTRTASRPPPPTDN